MIARFNGLGTIWKPVFTSYFLVIVLSQSAHATIVAHWKFEEGSAGMVATDPNGLIDETGNHPASPYGDPVYQAVATPNGGQLGLNFFGSGNPRVFVPDHSAFQLTHSMTVEAFVIRQPRPTGLGYIVFRGDDRHGNDSFALCLKGDGCVGFGIGSEIISPDPLPLGQLLHIAGTLDDATGQHKLYINGKLVASQITTVRPQGDLEPAYNPGLGIGNTQSDVYQEPFPGAIAEVRISDVALLPGQFLPEPATLSLLLLGGAALIRKKRK